MISAAELLFQRTKQRSLANINLISNVHSIMQNGLLSNEKAESIPHQSVALENVQNRRDQIRIPGGLWLHQYASLYFTPRNPMMYYLKCHTDINEICVLVASADILDFEGVIVTDGNAASSITRFYTPTEGIQALNFEMIKAKYWKDEDVFAYREKKRIKCAEVLVPNRVPPEYFSGALAPTEEARDRLLLTGFNQTIKISPDFFFMRGGEQF